MKYLRHILLVLLVASLAAPLYAQSMGTGTITGIVTDPSGATVAGASVTTLHLATRKSRTAKSDAHGSYSFTNMPIGQYTITVDNPGFKKFVQQNVHLNADTTATVNINLELGTAQETVTISAAPPRLQTE